MVAGYRSIAVASSKNHEYLKKLGATQLFDYHDSDYQDQIAKDPKNKGLKVAVDAIGKDTADQCFDVIEKCGTAAGQGKVQSNVSCTSGGFFFSLFFDPCFSKCQNVTLGTSDFARKLAAGAQVATQIAQLSVQAWSGWHAGTQHQPAMHSALLADPQDV
jgi:NADPH:quinone reductase-like Zn-dependent oxidoreductase